MSSVIVPYNYSNTSLVGGVNGIPARGQQYRVDFSGTWAIGDTYQFDIVTAAQTINLGSGRITGQVPVAALTLNQKLNFGAGTNWFFSAVGDPTGFDQQDTGAGVISMSDTFSSPEPVVAFAPYQGRMAVFTRHTAQIWVIDADPTLYAVQQVLQNTGTFAPLSVAGLGDLDVLFLSDSGIRSLRVHDSSLNAYETDIGSPIDLLVQADLLALGIPAASLACATVEPSSGRYWLYLNSKIYVLSYYPSNKIVAWTTYTCTVVVAGVTQTFVPQKFVVWQGQVYVLAQVNNVGLCVLQYGGTNNNTYDTTQAFASTSWLDAKKPATNKTFTNMDAAFSGSWSFLFGTDYVDESVQPVNSTPYVQPTFDLGAVGIQGVGTHFKVQAQSAAVAQPAILGSLVIHYNEGEET